MQIAIDLCDNYVFVLYKYYVFMMYENYVFMLYGNFVFVYYFLEEARVGIPIGIGSGPAGFL